MRKKFIATLLTIALSLATLTGCQSTTTSNDNTGSQADAGSNVEEEQQEDNKAEDSGDKLIINIATNISNSQAFVAEKQGYFEEELAGLNAEVHLETFANGPAIASAQASGDVDFGSMGDQPAIAAVAAGYGIKAVSLQSLSTEYNQLYALTDSGINSLEDLKGKKIGVKIGTVLEYQLLKALEQSGISADDVEIINAADTVTLLNSGEIDAAMSNVGTVQELIDDGTVKVVADGDDTGIITTIWLMGRDEFIKEHPEETVAVLRAYQRANEYIEEHEDELAQDFADYNQVDLSVAAATLKALHETTAITDDAIEAASQVLNFMVENELIENVEITVDDLYTDEFWKQVVDE